MNPESCISVAMGRRWLTIPLFSVLASAAYADNGLADRIDLFGHLSTETRLYPDSAGHLRRRSHANGVASRESCYHIQEGSGRIEGS